MDNESAQETAFRQVMAHRTMLRAYIGAIVKDPDLAEDTLSDVGIEIARAWGKYDAARPFAPWARGVARRVALANLRKSGGRPVLLDFDVLDAVGAQIDALGSESAFESRRQALHVCLERLSERNGDLIRLRYFENRTVREIAARVKRTTEALYMAFSRIHAALSECVERRLESAS